MVKLKLGSAISTVRCVSWLFNFIKGILSGSKRVSTYLYLYHYFILILQRMQGFMSSCSVSVYVFWGPGLDWICKYCYCEIARAINFNCLTPNGKHATERLMGQPEIHWPFCAAHNFIPILLFQVLLLKPIVGRTGDTECRQQTEFIIRNDSTMQLR